MFQLICMSDFCIKMCDNTKYMDNNICSESESLKKYQRKHEKKIQKERFPSYFFNKYDALGEHFDKRDYWWRRWFDGIKNKQECQSLKGTPNRFHCFYIFFLFHSFQHSQNNFLMLVSSHFTFLIHTNWLS